MPKPIERTAVAVWVHAEVQQNDDGTWTAIAYLDERPKGPAFGETREEALGKASDLASIEPGPFGEDDIM